MIRCEYEKALKARGITYRRDMVECRSPVQAVRWGEDGNDRIDIDSRLFIRCGIFEGDLERIAGDSKRVKTR